MDVRRAVVSGLAMNDPMDISNARSTDEAGVLSRLAAITGSGGWELDLASGRVTVTREGSMRYLKSILPRSN